MDLTMGSFLWMSSGRGLKDNLLISTHPLIPPTFPLCLSLPTPPRSSIPMFETTGESVLIPEKPKKYPIHTMWKFKCCIPINTTKMHKFKCLITYQHNQYTPNIQNNKCLKYLSTTNTQGHCIAQFQNPRGKN